MKKLTASTLGCMALLCFHAVGHAAPEQARSLPQTITYQGTLHDSQGNPVDDGEYEVAFFLYESEDSDLAVWSEQQDTIVINGLFNVLLGSIEHLDLPFDRQYWLGVAIGDGEELQPRTPLTATPYSLMAKSVKDGAITTSKLADEAVTQTKKFKGRHASASEIPCPRPGLFPMGLSF